MTKRLAIMLVALLALGLAVTACGDDDDDDNAATVTAPATTPEPDTGAADEGGAAPAASVKRAVDRCKQSIAAQPRLSSQLKQDLDEICQKAGSGDEEGVRKASREVCRRIVEETAPAGAAREQALAACDQSTATP